VKVEAVCSYMLTNFSAPVLTTAHAFY